MTTLNEIIKNKLSERSVELLKNDIIEAMKSEDESSTLVFVLGLNVLEEKLSIEEYELFENSL